jgi:rubrerythrin
METRYEFIQAAKEELGNDYKGLESAFENEYYEMVENEIKAGNTITQEVYDSLTEGQKFHFNKHYNYLGDKVQSMIIEVVIEEVTEQTVVNVIETIEEVLTEEITVNNNIEEAAITEPVLTVNVQSNKDNKFKVSKEKELFYWFNHKEKSFIKAYGNKVKIEGYQCYILENDDKTYSITEAKTGTFLCTHIKYKKASIETAKENVIKFAEKMDQLIQNSLNINGYSPLFKEDQNKAV